MHTTTIVELFGAPSSGKTTLAHALCARLGMEHPTLCTEYVQEAAKKYIYSHHTIPFQYQDILLGEQIAAIAPMLGQADIIITDAPLECACYYGDMDWEGPQASHIRSIASYPSYTGTLRRIPVYLNTTIPFQSRGRIHDTKESVRLCHRIRQYLDTYRPGYMTYTPTTYTATAGLVDDILAIHSSP